MSARKSRKIARTTQQKVKEYDSSGCLGCVINPDEGLRNSQIPQIKLSSEVTPGPAVSLPSLIESEAKPNEQEVRRQIKSQAVFNQQKVQEQDKNAPPEPEPINFQAFQENNDNEQPVLQQYELKMPQPKVQQAPPAVIQAQKVKLSVFAIRPSHKFNVNLYN